MLPVRSTAPSHALRGLCLLLSSVALTALGALAPSPASAAGSVATTNTLATSASKVNYGGTVTLTATLRRAADGKAVNGSIRFYRQTSTSAPWEYATSVATSNGVAKLNYTVYATYRWHASYAGSAAYAKSGSSNPTVYVASTLGNRVVQEAARHAGAPYQWGAAGPSRFDCSGFTLYVYGRFGISLPHNSGQQYSRTTHISRSAMRVGDLLFFRSSSGSITHVAIYAGNGYMWAATHSGSYVKKQRIYTSSYSVGRV